MFTDAWFTGLLKVTWSTTLRGTPDEPAPGMVEVTTGPASAVVNDQVNACASAFPPRSVTPLVTRAVNVVPNASGLDGVNVTVLPSTSTVPAIALPPDGVTVKVVVVRDDAAIASENVALISVFLGTRVSPLAGMVARTVGAVRSKSTPPSPLQETSRGAIATTAPRRRVRAFILLSGKVKAGKTNVYDSGCES